jgi:predicted dehydrogenase
MNDIRVAVIGAGSFGRHHVRVIGQLPGIHLTAIVDVDQSKLNALALDSLAPGLAPRLLTRIDDLIGAVDAAIVVTPTKTHESIAARLLESKIDVLIEKPIAESSAAGDRLTKLAQQHGRILQVGHLERFNPAIVELAKVVTIPLFFEVHRLSIFTPRSLDVDVILDLMIHDLDIVLTLAKQSPCEIRAAGISVLSPNVDIANVRLAFPSGCVANLTASRVSTEKVRKLRLFQPHQYISLDYARQDAVSFAVNQASAEGKTLPDIGFTPLPVQKAEPLQLELAAFFESVRSRTAPVVDGLQATAALRLAEDIAAKINEHGELVKATIGQGQNRPVR